MAGHLIEICHGFIVGNERGMIPCSPCDQFPPQARFLIDFEHVNAGVSDPRGQDLRERFFPALGALVG